MPSWDQLQEGSAPDTREYGPISRTDMVRYQGASGDFNPIHHDEEFAKSAGYPSVFSGPADTLAASSARSSKAIRA